MCSVCELKNSVRRNNLIRAPLTLAQGGGETIVLYFSSVQDHIPVMEWELWHRWYWISICESFNAGGRSRTSRRRIRVQTNQTTSSALPAPFTLTATFYPVYTFSPALIHFISLWSLLEFCALRSWTQAGRTADFFLSSGPDEIILSWSIYKTIFFDLILFVHHLALHHFASTLS